MTSKEQKQVVGAGGGVDRKQAKSLVLRCVRWRHPQDTQAHCRTGTLSCSTHLPNLWGIFLVVFFSPD